MTDAASAVLVRPATADDVPAITGIYNEGIRGRTATFETRERTADDVRGWRVDPRHPVLVAEADGRVVGWVAASTYRPRECYAGIAEFSVYVAGSARGRRVGRRAARRVPPRVRGGRAVESALAHLPREPGLAPPLRPPRLP